MRRGGGCWFQHSFRHPLRRNRLPVHAPPCTTTGHGRCPGPMLACPLVIGAQAPCPKRQARRKLMNSRTLRRNAADSRTSLPEVEKKRAIAFIDPRKCIGCGECILTCPTGAIQIQWNETASLFQKKMVEHAYGAVHKKTGKAIYLNFLTQITPACDCNPFSEIPIVSDRSMILCSLGGNPVFFPWLYYQNCIRTYRWTIII